MKKIKQVLTGNTEPNQCFKNTLICSYEFDKNSQYVEGFIIKDKVFCEHSWIETDGEILEITPNIIDYEYYPYFKDNLKRVRNKSFRNNTPPPMFMYNNSIRRQRKEMFDKLMDNGFKYAGDNNELNYTKYHKLKYFKINLKNKTLVVGKKEFKIIFSDSFFLYASLDTIEDIIDKIEGNQERLLKFYLNISSSNLKKKSFNIWWDMHITFDLEKNEVIFEEFDVDYIKSNINKEDIFKFKNKSYIQIGFINEVKVMITKQNYNLYKKNEIRFDISLYDIFQELSGNYKLMTSISLNDEFQTVSINNYEFLAEVEFDGERLFIDFINVKFN